jgi:hypothetical protein
MSFLKSSPGFPGEGDRTKCGGGAGARRRTKPFASLTPLHHPAGGPPPLQKQGRI